MTGRHAAGFLMREYFDRAHHVLVVEHGFAHAHEDEVGDALRTALLHSAVLTEYLPGRQVALEPHRCRCAELAVQRTADLCGHAYRQAFRFTLLIGFRRNKDGFDIAAVLECEKELSCPVLTGLFARELRVHDAVARIEFRAKRFRDVPACVEAGDVAVVQPVEELFRAKTGETGLPHFLFEFRRRQSVNIFPFKLCHCARVRVREEQYRDFPAIPECAHGACASTCSGDCPVLF